MSIEKIMRYNLPKNDIIDILKLDTEEFFSSNGIDVKDLSNNIYLDLFCSSVINALDYFLEWRHLPEKEIEKTLKWVSSKKRKEKEQMMFYCYHKSEEQLTLAVARLRVQIENKLTKSNAVVNETYLDQLMAKYDFYVLDSLDMDLKQRLTPLIGRDTWDVFEVMHYRRGVELINYGDFRILTWEKSRTE